MGACTKKKFIGVEEKAQTSSHAMAGGFFVELALVPDLEHSAEGELARASLGRGRVVEQAPLYLLECTKNISDILWVNLAPPFRF